MMSGDDFKATIKVIGLTQARVAMFLNVGIRTVNQWGRHGAPTSVELLLTVMAQHKMAPADVKELVGEHWV